jgi:hypothetical protein
VPREADASIARIHHAISITVMNGQNFLYTTYLHDTNAYLTMIALLEKMKLVELNLIFNTKKHL